MAKPKSKTRKRKHALRRQMRRAERQAELRRSQTGHRLSPKAKPAKAKTSSKPAPTKSKAPPGRAWLAGLKNNWSGVGLFGFIFLASVWGLLFQLGNLDLASAAPPNVPPTRPLRLANSHQTLETLKAQTAELQAEQSKHGLNLPDSQVLWPRLDQISTDLTAGQTELAARNIKAYRAKLNSWRERLNSALSNQPAAVAIPAAQTAASTNAGRSIEVPILIYHYTPPDFEAQLNTLAAKGYTTITMDNLSDQLRFGRPLPNKSVVLTFDDGFSSQMQAYEILRRHHMKATFYIITSGPASSWCIGVARRYDQVPGCGDAYMNWDEVVQLDRSGLIEIAAHSVDHLALAAQPLQMQQFQIQQSKQVLEERLGHPIHHFAYPYGSFNQTTIDLVKASGFLTAVTTQAGSSHNLDSIYSLARQRDVNQLP